MTCERTGKHNVLVRLVFFVRHRVCFGVHYPWFARGARGMKHYTYYAFYIVQNLVLVAVVLSLLHLTYHTIERLFNGW